MKHEPSTGIRPISLSDQNHPPMKRPTTQTTSGSMAGSGTKTNEPKS